MRFRFAARLLALSSGLLAAACSGGHEEELRVAVIGGSDAPFESGARLSTAGRLVRAATAEGLVAFDAQGRVIPALADRWIVTDDGLSYIFRLRDGTWPGGTPLTAEGAAAALRSAIAGLKGTTLAQDFLDVSEIRVMAGRVIEIRLKSTNPDLLQLLAQPELGLLRGGRKAAAGRAASGAGPMALARNGNVATLSPIAPRRLGLPDVKDWDERVRSIRLTGMAAERAVDRFRAGEIDIVMGGTFADFPLTSGLGFARGAITPDPAIGLFGLAVTRGTGFLETPENREALAMAVDREALASAMGVSGWAMTSRLVTPGLEGDTGAIGERWTDLDLPGRQANAAARIARWRAQSGEAAGPRLRIAVPAGPGADIVYTRLAEDWRAIGVTLARVGGDADADLRIVDSVARYPRAAWFLGQLSCAAQKRSGRGLCSPQADSLAARARAAADRASRAALLAQAEAELTSANVYIPLAVPLRWSLVRGTMPGFAANRFGVHPLMSLALLPK